MFWGTLGLPPYFTIVLCLTESIALVGRVVIIHNNFSEHYQLPTLNLTAAIVLGLHFLIYSYLISTSIHFKVIAAAAEKLRDYIARFTLHKLPSLHLVCIVMPPLIKDIMVCASRHDDSMSSTIDNSARRIVTTANQVVSCL